MGASDNRPAKTKNESRRDARTTTNKEAGGTPAPQTRQDFEFIEPRSTPFVPMRCRGELPHLYKEGGSYFVTFRLFDAVAPRTRAIDKKAIHRLSAEQIGELCEPPLRLGSCVLGRPAVADIVRGSLLHFDQERYYLGAWCVMPNHVHAVFTPLEGHEASDVLHSWKSFTAHKINRLLDAAGTLWERESFDHLIRSVEQYEAFVRYVEYNPVAAGLCATPEQWPYSSRHCGAGVPPAQSQPRIAGVPPADYRT